MPKELYLKPEIKSEDVEPGALAAFGSPGGREPFIFKCAPEPSGGFCCED
jgi:hypothetical protein